MSYSKNKWGIKGIRSNKSKVFLLDYSNQVLAEAQDLEDLKYQLETTKVIKALEFVKLETCEAKMVWITEDDLFMIESSPDMFRDLVFLKDHTGEKILAVGDFYYINSIMQKMIENKK